MLPPLSLFCVVLSSSSSSSSFWVVLLGFLLLFCVVLPSSLDGAAGPLSKNLKLDQIILCQIERPSCSSKVVVDLAFFLWRGCCLPRSLGWCCFSLSSFRVVLIPPLPSPSSGLCYLASSVFWWCCLPRHPLGGAAFLPLPCGWCCLPLLSWGGAAVPPLWCCVFYSPLAGGAALRCLPSCVVMSSSAFLGWCCRSPCSPEMKSKYMK